jgi:hypothetical protein
MVKTIRELVLAVAALACCAGCNLGAGIFPDRLMSYEAYADLAKYIDPDHVGDYNFEIIRDSSSGTEYLVLANDDGSFGDDCVVVFNADLKVLGQYTLDQLDAMDTGNPFNGRGAMVDASGMIVVGNRRFTVSSRTVTYLDTPPALWGYGFAIPEATAPNFSKIHAFSDSTNVLLEYTAYPSGWVSPSTVSPKFGGGTWGHLDGAWLLDVEIMLIVDRDGMQPQIHHLPRIQFRNQTLCDPLCYPVANIPYPADIRWETLGYTDAGFAVFKNDTSEYILFDSAIPLPITTSLVAPDEKRPYNQRHLYGRTSGWYVLDMKEMTLERRKWWWK